LLISGKQVFSGYIDSTLNKAAFTSITASHPDSFESENRLVKWYKTGDMVTQDENGNFIFIGRKDQQIKLLGQRIELSGIAHIVSSHFYMNAKAVMTKSELDIEHYCLYTSQLIDVDELTTLLQQHDIPLPRVTVVV